MFGVMGDFVNKTIGQLMKVDEFAQEADRRFNKVAKREDDLMSLALGQSNGGRNVLVEEENRSDSESVFFFHDRRNAELVFNYALDLGLVEGEVTFDDTINPKYDLGQYAVRVQPGVVYAKPSIYQRLIDEVRRSFGADDAVVLPVMEEIERPRLALDQIKAFVSNELRTSHPKVHKSLSRKKAWAMGGTAFYEGPFLGHQLMMSIKPKEDLVKWKIYKGKGRNAPIVAKGQFAGKGSIQKVTTPLLNAMRSALGTTEGRSMASLIQSLEEDESVGMQVGQTILKQMGGWGKIRMMTGAKNAVIYKAKHESKHGEGMGGVSFRFPRPGGSAASKRKRGRGMPNYVKIILNGKDLYDMSFGSIHGTSFKITKTYNDVYSDKLKSIFEKETALYLSL